MGKYSLDAFEQYPLTKLRPKAGSLKNCSHSILELHWSQLEPEGKPRLQPPQIEESNVLLRLRLDRKGDLPDACGFIRRIGAFYKGGKNFAGVILTSGGHSGAGLGQLVQAYAQGFDAACLLAEPGTELMERCLQEGLQPGLLLPLERGILPLRRSIAKGKLERTWRSRPVYLEAGRALTQEELEAAVRWHASGADAPAPLGAQLTLRRMMFPEGLTTGGSLPLRMWWQNLGSAPVYKSVHVVLALDKTVLRLPVTMTPGLGDSTLNCTVPLPRLPQGSYDLWVGLECNGVFLPLCMEVPEENGLYRIGNITLDETERPYLDTMWEEQYADGYYPLEDPAEPN